MQSPPHLEPENNHIPVIITLVDGEILKGSISVPRSKKLGDVLNGPDLFILFMVNGGELIYLARTNIAAIRSNKMPKARQLERSVQSLNQATAYDILNIKKGVSKEQIREAYHQLVKQYHPDQFLNITLPPEVRAYFEAVVLRLNAANNDLLDELDQIEQNKQIKSQRLDQQKVGRINYFGQTG